eukprot:UN20496
MFDQMIDLDSLHSNTLYRYFQRMIMKAKISNQCKREVKANSSYPDVDL